MDQYCQDPETNNRFKQDKSIIKKHKQENNTQRIQLMLPGPVDALPERRLRHVREGGHRGLRAAVVGPDAGSPPDYPKYCPDP